MKKRKQRIFIFLVIAPLLLLTACSENGDSLQNLADIELESNQTLITGQVTSRVGNDIELALGTLASAQGPGNMEDMASGDTEDMSAGDSDSMPSFDAESMPSGGEGGDFSGEAPQGGDSGGQMPQDGEMPDGAVQGDADTSEDTAQDMAASGYQIQLSGETMSIRIPVGTDVLVTSNDELTVSSFGRIQEEDILQLILQTQTDGTQVVIKAQIME